MLQTSVFAAAISRLHADLIIVRLRRAGIAIDQISVIFPTGCRPNSAVCWLDGSSRFKHSERIEFSVAGPIQAALIRQRGATESVSRRLLGAGLTTAQGLMAEETLLEGRIMVCAQPGNEREFPHILQVFNLAGAENVFSARVDTSGTLIEARYPESDAMYHLTKKQNSNHLNAVAIA